MDFIDYYKTLGIDKKATQDEVKKAYRKLARKFHPDLNPEDESAKKKFQEINEAHEVLSDPEKRKKYDLHGKDWANAGAAGTQRGNQRRGAGQSAYGQGFGSEGAGGFDEYDFSDFFSSMFGGQEHGGSARSGRGGFRGQDIHAEFSLHLREAYTTHKQVFTVNGKNIRITIPAGVEDGQTIKLSGHGGGGVNGGPAGDLYITFRIEPDPDFKRIDHDLYATYKLPLYTAILGGEILVDTLDGKVKLKIKPETQNGTKVKLKGKGFPKYKKEDFGDLYITYDVKIPTNLSQEEKNLFSALSKLNPHDSR